MNKFISIFFIFYLFSFAVLSETNEKGICEHFFNTLDNESENNILYWSPQFEFDPVYGFTLKQDYDFEKDDWSIFRNKDNFPYVFKTTYGTSAYDQLKKNDIILKYNDVNVDEVDNDKLWEIWGSSDTLNLTVKREINSKEEILNITLEKKSYSKTEVMPIFRIKSFDNIDVKNSDYTILYDLEYYWFDDRLIEFAKNSYEYFGNNIEESIDFHVDNELDEDLAVDGIQCIEDYDKFDINLWLANLEFTNLVKDDLENKTKKIIFDYNFWADGYEELTITIREKGIATFHTSFNLRAFPFDSHNLEFEYADVQDTVSNVQLTDISTSLMPLTDKLKRKIPEWNIPAKYSNLEAYTYFDKYDYEYDGVGTKFLIERNSSYYIYKVIAPIILILLVCWSVFWLRSEQIESRLTVSIVCLLTLIAYNFIVDENIPKLAYLTALDQIILSSYFFASIPTVLSIYFSTQKEGSAILNYQNHIRLLGPLLYLLIILLIMYSNINGNPSALGVMKNVFG